jgi:hypothetical protein
MRTGSGVSNSALKTETAAFPKYQKISLPQQSITMCRGCAWLIDGVWIRWLDLLTPYTFNSGLQVIQIYHWSTNFTVHRYTCTRVLSLPYSYPGNRFQHSGYTSLTVTAAHMKSSLHSLIPFLPFLLSHLWLPSPSVLCCNCQLRNSTQF